MRKLFSLIFFAGAFGLLAPQASAQWSMDLHSCFAPGSVSGFGLDRQEVMQGQCYIAGMFNATPNGVKVTFYNGVTTSAPSLGTYFAPVNTRIHVMSGISFNMPTYNWPAGTNFNGYAVDIDFHYNAGPQFPVGYDQHYIAYLKMPVYVAEAFYNPGSPTTVDPAASSLTQTYTAALVSNGVGPFGSSSSFDVNPLGGCCGYAFDFGPLPVEPQTNRSTGFQVVMDFAAAQYLSTSGDTNLTVKDANGNVVYTGITYQGWKWCANNGYNTICEIDFYLKQVGTVPPSPWKATFSGQIAFDFGNGQVVRTPLLFSNNWGVQADPQSFDSSQVLWAAVPFTATYSAYIYN